jgi:hypothetical protein
MNIRVKKHFCQTQPRPIKTQTLTQVSGYSFVKEQSSSCTSAQMTEIVYFNSQPEGQEKAVVKAMLEALILRHEARRRQKV